MTMWGKDPLEGMELVGSTALLYLRCHREETEAHAFSMDALRLHIEYRTYSTKHGHRHVPKNQLCTDSRSVRTSHLGLQARR